MNHVLLTGATGLVGRYLLRDLLARSLQVAVLCRSNRVESAAERVERIMQRWEGLAGHPLPRPVVLEGNLCEPLLGLDAHSRAWVSKNCDIMLHNAASMTFKEDKHGEPFRTNVEGMRNVLELCRQAGIRKFHHVSTAYVCGLREGRIYEHELDVGQENGNVYEISKMAAEKLVRAADFLDELTVYRPASVVGDSQTGYTTSSHGFYLPLQLAFIMADKVPPELMGERFLRLLGLRGDEGKNLVAVDWLASAIVHLVTHPEHHGQTYHLTNPRPVTVELIQQVVREAIEKHSTRRFIGKPTEEELLGYEELFRQYMEVYRSHWRDDPIFDRTNTDRAIGNDLPCVELDHEKMLRVASYPVQHNFMLNRDDAAHGTPTRVPESPTPAPAIFHYGTAEKTDVPIAIVGMACKLPGADGLEQYWRMLVSGTSAIAELPSERLDQSLYYDPRRGQRGKTYSKLGAIVSSRQFNRQACPIPSDLESSVDNVHLLMCEVAAAACRHAGLDPFNLPLRNTGVYIGHAQGSDLAGQLVYGTCIEEAAQFLRNVPGFQELLAEQQEATIRELVETIRGQMPQRRADSPDLAINMVAGTISKAFGLNGPFMAVNSACASSLQTIQLAARALQLGRIDMAIVGGASDCKEGSLVLFSHAQSMSETGSRPFDADADGLICSEGYVALVLKTLPRALADGDPIQAIIPGLGASSDGRGKSLWAPRKEGQVKAMERAYRNGLDMSTLQYIEAHATSTSLGDATELSTLTEILSDKFPAGKKIPVSSVKANIGHALEAAGIAGLIKTVLCMQHRTFVPAINIRSLNPKIDWNSAPFFIPQQVEPWPEQPKGLPRRAAVNAFGIGGLNMHVVLDEFTEDRREELKRIYQASNAAAISKSSDSKDDAVAVIGMGCIFPCASDPSKFWDLITSGRDAKISAPPGRWRTDLACEPGTRKPYHASTSLGGYITDFTYDWRKHKVPPKQVEQADPLQFMLLEAAQQALVDAGYDTKEFDRTRAAVFVGTEFNGDFGSQLALSLRLPHVELLLREILAKRGVAAERSSQIAAQFSDTLLAHWPALIDESGSFSTSTLASRITKTMNLMGGAASIDAGDASSAAALASSVDLLLSGDCDLLVCAGGQRCMNLPQYEAMTQAGLLAAGDTPRSPFDAKAAGIVPGEGVGVVLLKRLSDARRDGDPIRAVIRGVGAAHSESVQKSLSLAIERGLKNANVDAADVALIEIDGTGISQIDSEQLKAIAEVYGRSPRKEPVTLSTVSGQIGHTMGASAMASFIKASLEVERGEAPRAVGLETPLPIVAQKPTVLRPATVSRPISLATQDGRRIAAVSSFSKGLAYHILLERGEKVPVKKIVAPPAVAIKPTAVTVPPQPAGVVGWRICRLGAATSEALSAKLQHAIANATVIFAAAETTSFAATDRERIAIVADSAEKLAEKLQLTAKQWTSAAALPVLEQQGCFYRQVPSRRPRIVFLFPGQGSQYAGMLRELVRDVPAAAAMMRDLDAIMTSYGFQTFAQMAWENPEQLGADIWVTQVAMLMANLIAYAAVVDSGVRPDVVTSHSYGEFAALTAAGAWDLESVLTAARARVDGILVTSTARGAMLATTAPPQVIEQLSGALPERAYIANYNAPDQAIVGGRKESLEQLAKLLDVLGHKSQLIAVPCPFHTPLMQGAADVLARSLDELSISPPRVPFLSSVTNRYVAEPAEICANLVAQLTTPVRYMELVNRLADEQETVFIEVGPQQALTKLNRRIFEGRSVAGTIGCDHAKRPGIEQLFHVKALLECVGADSAEPSVPRLHIRADALAMPQVARKGTVSHIDATERRRNKMRETAAQGTPHVETKAAIAPAPTFKPQHQNNGATKHAPPVAAKPAVKNRIEPQPTVQVSPKPAMPEVAELEKFLINFVVEQTGYPPEVVELDADLEADLGIDSIKKAQLFGELAEYFDVQPNDDMTLDDFPTLRHVTDFLQGAAFKKELASEPLPIAPVQPSEATVPAEPLSQPVAKSWEQEEHGTTATLAAPSTTGLQDTAELEKFLVNFVVEQTGYPPEVVELDADLEADLGIDSIKKAQLFGELSEYFDVQPDENLTLDDFPTLRHVVNFLAQGDEKKNDPVIQNDEPEASVEVADVPAAPYDYDDLQAAATERFVLRTVPSPLNASVPAMPEWQGAALIVGNNPAADALYDLLQTAGVTVRVLEISDDLDATLAAFEQLWNEQPLVHLFIMTGRDQSAGDISDDAVWQQRKYRTALLPYFLCQRWVQLAGQAKLLDRTTLVAATALNGDLGFSGNVAAPEGGALTGLIKAIFIEVAILRNLKNMLAKAIDAPDDEPPAQLAANICRELASKMVDYEVAYVGGERRLQNAYRQPAPVKSKAEIRRGGTWVLTGGARGITAECALELGRRFGLKLHLIGTSSLPQIDPAWRSLSDDDLKTLKSTVMRDARAAGQPMDEAWNRVQKDLEIDRSLGSFADAGIDVTYHTCDVADSPALARVLETIRQTSGPIEGIVHGAGIERSCNYERKKRDVVMATIATKVDGALNLMRLTQQDPIQYFLGFGSVSGRLGSNGQTDYCLASELLCKLAAWYRGWRPGVRAVGFHWHPWEGVGMAATPETLKMLKLTNGPKPMPKDEGVRHLIRELYAGAPNAEVLITDADYHGRFYGSEEVAPAKPPADLPWDALPWKGIASRHTLIAVEAPLPSKSKAALQFDGPACIFGNSRVAHTLRDRLVAAGVAVNMLPVSTSSEETMAAVESAYAIQPPRYLFLMSARDEQPSSLLDSADWQRRRAQNIVVPFLAAQHWFRLRRKAKDQNPVTVVAITSLGGDFGLSGNIAQPEGGALSGLLKALYVEDTRKPQRELTIKVIDAPADESPEVLCEAILRELAANDPEIEVGWLHGKRTVLRSVSQPIESLPKQDVRRGTNWVITGGARGITAAVALELGKRFGLKLHLIGRSPAPQADAPWRNYNDDQLSEFKSQVVRQAVAAGRSPERDWDRIKADREIDETLRKCVESGVQVTYHSCDLADRDRLDKVLDKIRRTNGLIDGIVHGAGWARPGRFDSKSRDCLETTLAGKLDGAINLMSLTQQDKIRHWIGFGSISGRYGGNGLSDYAAANDMLAKLVSWYRSQRPDCAACCIHWQSWDEVGMAMMAENSSFGAKGVLKMDFMSPREGVEHLCRELEAGLPNAETIITDQSFERIFYPFAVSSSEPASRRDAATWAGLSETGDANAGVSRLPLVHTITPLEQEDGILAEIEFDPTADPFLYEHKLRGKPLLPAVVGLEALAEAAALCRGKPVVSLRQIEFKEGVQFHSERTTPVRVRAVPQKDHTIRCELLSDFQNRAGVVIQKDRLHFHGLIDTAESRPSIQMQMPAAPTAWNPFVFQNDGPMFHGPTLQGLKGVALDGQQAWGHLTALSLQALGGSRTGHDWIVPATLIDAAFYVCGIHLWICIEQITALPQAIELVQLGRMPRDNENCLVHVQCREVQSRQAIYDFTVFGDDRSVIVRVEGYQCVMLKA